MAIVIGIKFKTSQKVYYFDPNGEQFRENDNAIIETARGLEYAKVAFGNREVADADIVMPLKPVIRKATEQDDKQHEKNIAERDRLVSETQKKANEHKLPMKVVDAEYTFDRAKIIIYFTADNRIDFRELVRDLAGMYHNRIELRQIYERENIKLQGALAQCGRPCCCITFLQDYDKVSIKMAKYQGLSLNPTKINGCCGKLMCCLRYENDYYQTMYKKMPKVHSTCKTPDGEGVVLENDPLRAEVKVKVCGEDGAMTIKRYALDKIKSKATQQEENVTDDNAETEPES